MTDRVRQWNGGSKETPENSPLRALIDGESEPELRRKTVELMQALNLLDMPADSRPENVTLKQLGFRRELKTFSFEPFTEKHQLGVCLYLLERDSAGIPTTRADIAKFIGRGVLAHQR